MFKEIRTGILSPIWFIIIHIVFNFIMLMLISYLFSVSLDTLNWLIYYAIIFLIYFMLGFSLGLIKFKITKNKKLKITSLLITFVLIVSLLLAVYIFFYINIHNDSLMAYLLFNAPHALVYSLGKIKSFIFLFGQSFFFVLGIYVQNITFSRKNTKHKQIT